MGFILIKKCLIANHTRWLEAAAIVTRGCTPNTRALWRAECQVCNWPALVHWVRKVSHSLRVRTKRKDIPNKCDGGSVFVYICKGMQSVSLNWGLLLYIWTRVTGLLLVLLYLSRKLLKAGHRSFFRKSMRFVTDFYLKLHNLIIIYSSAAAMQCVLMKFE